MKQIKHDNKLLVLTDEEYRKAARRGESVRRNRKGK